MGSRMNPRNTHERKEDAVTNKHPVRVTQEPGVVRNVDSAELIDLARQGLIHSYEHTPAAEAVLGGTVKGLKAWKAAEKGDDTVEAPADLSTPDGADPTQKGK